MSPFQALYGRQPPHLTRIRHGITTLGSLEELLQAHDAQLDDLNFHLLRAQQIMKHNEDKHRRPLEFNVGDEVFLKLQPYRKKSLARHLNEKLAPRFYGPYQVSKRVGPTAYELVLPPHSCIHPVFHISH